MPRRARFALRHRVSRHSQRPAAVRRGRDQLADRRGRRCHGVVVGRLEAARYAEQISQLEALGLLPKGKLTPATAFTNEFLP